MRGRMWREWWKVSRDWRLEIEQSIPISNLQSLIPDQYEWLSANNPSADKVDHRVGRLEDLFERPAVERSARPGA